MSKLIRRSGQEALVGFALSGPAHGTRGYDVLTSLCDLTRAFGATCPIAGASTRDSAPETA
jgi:hypothetical protein